jgi:allantoicase
VLDLLAMANGGRGIIANNEHYGAVANLTAPGRGVNMGDGWETRRRREPGHDWALVRLGLPGVIRGVVIDTAWFRGNYPPHASVEAAALEGYPTVAELEAADWTEIVPRNEIKGDAEHFFEVADERRYTHVRLNIFPDGGVARLRVHGEVRPDLALYDGLSLDLAALENGALVTACSNQFYSSPNNVIAPGLARHQAEGWETARRRDGGNDWLMIRLAGAGVIRLAEIDTTNLLFNAPGEVSIKGTADGTTWFGLLPRTRLQPDTPHRFRIEDAPVATHVRVDIHPDGGLARLRLHGSLSER